MLSTKNALDPTRDESVNIPAVPPRFSIQTDTALDLSCDAGLADRTTWSVKLLISDRTVHPSARKGIPQLLPRALTVDDTRSLDPQTLESALVDCLRQCLCQSYAIAPIMQRALYSCQADIRGLGAYKTWTNRRQIANVYSSNISARGNSSGGLAPLSVHANRLPPSLSYRDSH